MTITWINLMCVYLRDFNPLRCDSMSVHVSNLAIMSSGIGGNNNHGNNHLLHQQRMIIAKPTQHHYLLLVRLPAPALIQQRCSFRQGKNKNKKTKKKITKSRRIEPRKGRKTVEQFVQQTRNKTGGGGGDECLIKLPSKGHRWLARCDYLHHLLPAAGYVEMELVCHHNAE